MATFSILETYVSDENTWRAVVINNALVEYFSLREVDVASLGKTTPLKGGVV